MRDDLIPLHSLTDQRLAPDEPDVRGWELLDAGGTPRGRVEELLVERATSEVAALAVTGRVSGHEVVYVVPMERSRIDERHRRVVTDMTAEQLDTLPRLTDTPDTPTPASHAADMHAADTHPTDAHPAHTDTAPTADLARGHPGVTVERAANGDEIVRVPVVEEELVVERRPVVKEVVVIRKRAIHDERTVSADLRRERVEVDRHGDIERR